MKNKICYAEDGDFICDCHFQGEQKASHKGYTHLCCFEKGKGEAIKEVLEIIDKFENVIDMAQEDYANLDYVNKTHIMRLIEDNLKSKILELKK